MTKKEKMALVASKYDDISRILIREGVKKQDREDVLHEIFVYAFNWIDKLKNPQRLDRWLWQITRFHIKRYFITSWEKEDVEEYLPEYEQNKIRNTASILELDEVAKTMEELLLREKLASVLMQLDKRSLTILNLYYGMKYNMTEISALKGIKYGVVKFSHARALEKLDEMIKELEREEEEQTEKEEKWVYRYGFQSRWPWLKFR